MAAIDPTAQRLDTERGMDLKAWLAVLAVAAGTFLVVTVENLPMGLLTQIANDLAISKGQAGMMVTVSGLIAAITAAILPVAIRRADRRVVLIGLMLLIIVANLLCAMTHDYALLLAARCLAGVAVGGFWSLAAGLAVRLVSPVHVAKATAMIFFGAMVANVAGVPAGTLIGAHIGWRVAFFATAAFAVLLLLALTALLPSMPTQTRVKLSTLVEQLRTPAVRTGVIATFLLVSGHYGAFTFVSPILQQISGIDAHAIGPLLLTFGVAGIFGNFLAGWAAARNVKLTIVLLSLALATTLASFSFLGTSHLTGAALLVAWGLAFGALPVSVQTWIIKAAPNATEAATGLNTFMFNLAIAGGALLGGIIVDHTVIGAVLWAAAALVALTAVVVSRTQGLDR